MVVSKPALVIFGLIILFIWWLQPSEWTAEVARNTALSCMQAYPTDNQVAACMIAQRSRYAR